MEKEILEYVKYGVWILFGSGVVFEISPLKFSPISTFLSWLGNKLNRDVKKDIELVKTDIKTVKVELQDHKVESQRRNILNFADKIMRGENKSREDYDCIIKIHDEYEKYITTNNLENGQINLAFEYITSNYQDCRKNNSFLK